MVKLDTELDLIVAWNPSNPDLSYHNGNYLEFQQNFSSDGTCVAKKAPTNHLWIIIHGAFMGVAWTLIGLLQICTNRYWRTNWRWNKVVHAILGFFALALTLTAGFIALKKGGWNINSESSLHSKVGFSCFILGLVLMLGGIIANIIRLYVPMSWNTRTVLAIGKIHKYFGWLVILFSEFVVCTGIIRHLDKLDELHLGWVFTGVSAGLFCLILIVAEINHRLQLRKDVVYAVPAQTMSKSEFSNNIQNGRKLIILDELVLDVELYTDQHPGGRFVLQHNIGRDISKFFYGGYQLEGNLGASPAKGYAHSSYAKRIVNDLAIARYQPRVECASTVCRVRQDLCAEVAPSVKATASGMDGTSQCKV